MKLEQAREGYVAYVENQQRQENLRKQEREEKLKEKYSKYKSSIEKIIDNKITNNYSSSFISVDILKLAQAIDCEDLSKDFIGKVFLKHYQLGEYVALVYHQNGFTVDLQHESKIRGQIYGENCVRISGWR